MERVLTTDRVGTDEFKLPQNEAAAFAEIAANFELVEPLIGADDLFDRVQIERQARELIENHTRIETSYKSHKTYLDDARTLLFEALTASGHLSVVETTGSLDEIHQTMLSVLLNAYSDRLPAHEQRRRFMEICEELTIQAVELKIAEGELPDTLEVATISDFIAEGAISEKSAELIGYRPSNKKGMLRSSRLRNNCDGTFTRISQQVSRSNSDAVRSSDFLIGAGVNLRSAEHADVSVLGTQLMHEMSQGVLGLLKRLDRHHGARIRYGEQAHAGQSEYEDLRHESAERERVAQCYVEQLADFTKRLDSLKNEGLITEKQYQTQFKQEVANILRAICVMDPSYAVGCFGEKAAVGFMRASDLTAAGDYAGASAVLDSNRVLEESVSFCGMSISAEEAQKMGVEVDPMTKLLKLGKESWRWSKGVCRVNACPTRPGRTDVGPCSVCRGCQHEFDHGRNPSTTYKRMRKVGKKVTKKATAFLQWPFGSNKKQVVGKNDDKTKSAEHEKIVL